MCRRLWHWLRRVYGYQGQESHDARQSALLSREQAEQDWQVAMELGVEAAGVTEVLRAHNAANRYDDWLREIVRR